MIRFSLSLAIACALAGRSPACAARAAGADKTAPVHGVDCTWKPARPGPGDPVELRVTVPAGTEVAEVRFDRLPVALRRHPGGTLVGRAAIGRREPLGAREVSIRYRGPDGVARVAAYAVKTRRREYPTQRLTVPQALASPPEPLRYRLYNEASAQTFGPTARGWAPPRAWKAPVEGAVTAAFGSRRIFNGNPRGYHLGVDLRAGKGAAVTPPAPARVASTREEYLGGRTLRLDHGDGWITHFMHLEEIRVAVGEPVLPGQAVATAGSSGRVTGPHLHWAVTWRGRYVDPMALVAGGEAP